MYKKFLVSLFSFILLMSPILLIEKLEAKSAKPTVVYLYQSSCRPCARFEQNVLSDPEVQRALTRFNFKKVNALSMKGRGNVTPTIIIYDTNDQVVRKFVPTQNVADFLDALNSN